MYSLYKKKRKPYIIIDNYSPIKAKNFKLAGYLDFHVPYQKFEFHNVSGLLTIRFLPSCKGTHETKSHNTQYVMIRHRIL